MARESSASSLDSTASTSAHLPCAVRRSARALYARGSYGNRETSCELKASARALSPRLSALRISSASRSNSGRRSSCRAASSARRCSPASSPSAPATASLPRIASTNPESSAIAESSCVAASPSFSALSESMPRVKCRYASALAVSTPEYRAVPPGPTARIAATRFAAWRPSSTGFAARIVKVSDSETFATLRTVTSST